MRMLRRLERRLESLLDGVAGRIFRGPLHPSELAGRIIREADLSLGRTQNGPVAANHYTLWVHPRAVEADDASRSIGGVLAQLVEEAAFDRGWRLEGPAEVAFEADPDLSHTGVRCEGQVRPGRRRPWARLRAADSLSIEFNRCVVGRGADADVVVADPTVSRRHAMIWREAGRDLIRDLGSSNGTRVDGIPAASEPVELGAGAVVTLGEAVFRFEPE